MNLEKQAQKFFDEFPDEDVLKDYDNFFVGGASQKLILDKRVEDRKSAWQLSGIDSIEDLKNAGKSKERIEQSLITLENDLDTFIIDRIDITDDSQYEELFYIMKEKAFKIFNFTDIKKGFSGNEYLQERDLILSDDDHYTIEYLRTCVKDYFAISSIATLIAFDEMGIDTVLLTAFKHLSCPLCRAHDGLFYNVRELISTFSGGGSVTHPYCDCRWFPVIRREMYAGPLTGHLNKDFQKKDIRKNDVSYIKMPVEFQDIPNLNWVIETNTVEFVDMKKHLTNNSEIDSEGVVAYFSEKENRIFVHNSYVGFFGPGDFLYNFSTQNKRGDGL